MVRSAFAAAVALILLTSAPASSQTVLDTPEGRIEIIGLRDWTATMLKDSIAYHAPGVSLASYACAAVLRSELGFPDASVTAYPASVGGRARDYIVITLVEPRDSVRIRYRSEPTDSGPDRPEWLPGIEVLTEHNQDFQTALQAYAYVPGLRLEDSTRATGAGLSLRAFLRSKSAETDFQLALTTLAGDGNYLNRVIAAAILGNFPERDSTWLALADALRDPIGMVSSTAGQVLSTLARQSPRPVDWAPAADTLRYLLDGTNLFAHNTIMLVLVATEVAPALAPPLLRNGGELVLAKVRSADPAGKPAAIRLLTQLSGHGLGDDADAWEAWIIGL